jgi:vanillate O-demethylase ferredoxin subunit
VSDIETNGAANGAPANTAFQIKLARSGRLLDVPADKSVVQVLHAAGINVPVACEEGVCGTCETKILAGTPDHRDQVLSPKEQAAGDRFTPCCSRSLTPLLELDL